VKEQRKKPVMEKKWLGKEVTRETAVGADYNFLYQTQERGGNVDG